MFNFHSESNLIKINNVLVVPWIPIDVSASLLPHQPAGLQLFLTWRGFSYTSCILVSQFCRSSWYIYSLVSYWVTVPLWVIFLLPVESVAFHPKYGPGNLGIFSGFLVWEHRNQESMYILNENGQEDEVEKERTTVPMNWVKSLESLRWKAHVVEKQFRKISTAVPQLSFHRSQPSHSQPQDPSGQSLQSSQWHMPLFKLACMKEACCLRIIIKSMSVYAIGVKTFWISESWMLVASGVYTKWLNLFCLKFYMLLPLLTLSL